ncbi:MAG: acyloxyacyl hydrolase [Proteobacteria bacterium]|nr:acyloxyacyl hydrolase [Pseudomonadota bacterium]
MPCQRFVWVLFLGSLAACQSPPEEAAIGSPPAWLKVQDFYVQALARHGPYRFKHLYSPALVVGEAALVTIPALVPAPVTIPAPVPVAAPTAAPALGAEVTPAQDPEEERQGAQRPEKAGRKDGAKTLSEVRLGVFKHAVAFGKTAKETGADVNIEALFTSPDWLAPFGSPRPHLGFTANASTKNTDFIYAGLTWEWIPLGNLFVNLGLGLSVHNGMLDNSRIEGRARSDRLEFGCRALFRESLEMGYRVFGRHSLSVMWAHHSHASLCLDDDDGIDNAGLRYGYRL